MTARGDNTVLYRFCGSEPRWINFENPTGERGKGGLENQGAKGHAWEHFASGEEKMLCDFSGFGIIRRIWITLSDRSPEVLQNVWLKMFWDHSAEPQVSAPLGDFFCMGLGVMRGFENRFFSTAEGRSFSCVLPMPFRRHARITLHNASGKDINNLFYDINLTLEPLGQDDMYFCAEFHETGRNALCENVIILRKDRCAGRFLGANIAVIPDEARYPGLWWGEGEVKLFIGGDDAFPTLVGTGAEDYVGSAWELGEFINDCQGCVTRVGNAVSMYRFHVDDPIFFTRGIRAEIQTMGGGAWEKVRAAVESGAPCVPVSYDDGDFHGVYKSADRADLKGYVNFFRQDHYRTVAYYYAK